MRRFKRSKAKLRARGRRPGVQTSSGLDYKRHGTTPCSPPDGTVFGR